MFSQFTAKRSLRPIINTITHGPLRMERSQGQNGTLPSKCVGTLAHSREIIPILRKPRGRQRTCATVQYQAQKSAFEKTRVVLKSPLRPNHMSD